MQALGCDRLGPGKLAIGVQILSVALPRRNQYDSNNDILRDIIYNISIDIYIYNRYLYLYLYLYLYYLYIYNI